MKVLAILLVLIGFVTTVFAIPEQLPISNSGQLFSDFEKATDDRLDWARLPTYIPNNFSELGYLKQESGMVKAIYAKSSTLDPEKQLRDYVQSGIVITYSIDGVGGIANWDVWAKNRADESASKYVTQHDGITILLTNSTDFHSADYRDGRNKITITSATVDTKELDNMIRSMFAKPKPLCDKLVDGVCINSDQKGFDTATQILLFISIGGIVSVISLVIWKKTKSKPDTKHQKN